MKPTPVVVAIVVAVVLVVAITAWFALVDMEPEPVDTPPESEPGPEPMPKPPLPPATPAPPGPSAPGPSAPPESPEPTEAPDDEPTDAPDAEPRDATDVIPTSSRAAAERALAKPVSMQLSNGTVGEALAKIVEATGLTIRADAEISNRRMSISLEQVDAKRALEVLAAFGGAKVEIASDGTIEIR